MSPNHGNQDPAMETKDASATSEEDIEKNGRDNTASSIIPPRNAEPNLTADRLSSFHQQTTASSFAHGASSRGHRRLRSRSTPVGHSLSFVPEHFVADNSLSEAGGDDDDVDEVAVMRDLILGGATIASSNGSTGDNNNNNNNNRPPSRTHRQRARQATDSTMIMSNTAKAAVSEFFREPTEAKDGSGIPATIGKDMSVLDANNKKPNEQGRPQSWGRGILDDFCSTIGKHWLEEMTNLRFKSVAISLFLFFACVAPAITFGAMYSKITHNYIGTVEMLLATAWCGVFFALLGGQPVMINGGTGPVLAFSGVLYKLAETMDVPFLVFNAWCGLWVGLFMFIAAFTDSNRIIRYATRFTDEIFAFLIAAIFIIDALGSPFHDVGVYYYFVPSHESHHAAITYHGEDPEEYNYLEVALLSLVVCLGTTLIAYFFRGLKYSSYFWWPWMRNMCSDFAITLAIVTFTFVAHVLFPSIHLEELKVPHTLSPTFICCDSTCTGYYPEDCPEQAEAYGHRPWLVDLLDLNGKTYVPFVAAGPAILAFILMFLDNGVTIHLMTHPCHKMTHGTAYNYDTLIIGGMIAVNSLLGLPWLVAATVRSLNHLHALAEKSADGRTIYSVLETRLTGLFAHLLILGSLFMLDVIRLIPVPVLYGVFLYMGLTTLPTNQFWNRILLFFMQPSMYVDANTEPFIENVMTWRIHMYTCIQIVLFATLYGIKSVKSIAIAFPVIIAACIPIRLYLLPRLFTEDELILLDGGDDELIDAWLEEHGAQRKIKYVELRPHPDMEIRHGSVIGGSVRDSHSIVSALDHPSIFGGDSELGGDDRNSLRAV